LLAPAAERALDGSTLRRGRNGPHLESTMRISAQIQPWSEPNHAGDQRSGAFDSDCAKDHWVRLDCQW
jgi:hypothetical protein